MFKLLNIGQKKGGMPVEATVLALYDLRGIQSFIFRTNKLREIIGASEIIRTLLENALSGFAAACKDEGLIVVTDWKTQPFRNLKGGEAGEVLYSGGGNTVVLWRDADIAQRAGRFMSRYVLEHAYSVGLSYATTPVTGNFREDYKRLCANLDIVKNLQSNALPLPCVPFSVTEEGTGLPAIRRRESARISKETALKIEAAKDVYKESKPRYTLEIDRITGMDGKNFVAVVHVDGNSMGTMIRRCMTNSNDGYEKAVSTMRTLSRRITKSFSDALDNAFDAQSKALGMANDLPFRSVICAGDDITFICRADLAFSLTETLLTQIKAHAMRDGEDGKADPEFTFSACAGMAFVCAHYPFSRAYDLAEELCGAAKTKARTEQPEKPGSFLDFHIVQSGASGSLKSIRKREYVSAEGRSLLLRPLCCDDAARADSAEALHTRMMEMQALPRTWVKQARNAYTASQYDVLSAFRRAGVHHAGQVGSVKVFDENKRALYFDALEIMDMIRQERGGERHAETTEN